MIGDLLAARWGRLGANTDSFNKGQYELGRDRSLPEIRQRLELTCRDWFDLLPPYTDEPLLNEYGRIQINWWAKQTTYAHYEEYIAPLTAFRWKIQPPKGG